MLIPFLTMKTFREELSEYLEKKKLRPYKFAEKAGVPWGSIYRFLNKGGDLKNSTVEKLRESMR